MSRWVIFGSWMLLLPLPAALVGNGWEVWQLRELLIGNSHVCYYLFSFLSLLLSFANSPRTVTSKSFLDAAEFAKSIIDQPSQQGIVQTISTKLGVNLSPQPALTRFNLFPNASFYIIKGTGWSFSVILFPVSESRTSVRVDLLHQQPAAPSAPDTKSVSDALYETLEMKVRQLERDFTRHLQKQE